MTCRQAAGLEPLVKNKIKHRKKRNMDSGWITSLIVYDPFAGIDTKMEQNNISEHIFISDSDESLHLKIDLSLIYKTDESKKKIFQIVIQKDLF